MSKIFRSGERRFFTYRVLHEAALQAIETSPPDKLGGGFFSWLTACVLEALALEAFLNHVAQEKLGFWRAIDRLSPQDKLEVLGDTIGFSFDRGRRPYQGIKLVIRIRNLAAHGNTQRIPIERTRLYPGERAPTIESATLEELVSRENTAQIIEDTLEVMRVVFKAAELGDDPLGSFTETKLNIHIEGDESDDSN